MPVTGNHFQHALRAVRGKLIGLFVVAIHLQVTILGRAHAVVMLQALVVLLHIRKKRPLMRLLMGPDRARNPIVGPVLHRAMLSFEPAKPTLQGRGPKLRKAGRL